MSLFNIFNVAGSAMSAQSQRLNVVASNIANADSTTSSTGETYKAKQVVFQAVPLATPEAAGVKVRQVVEDASPPKMVFDPKHPQADENGYVAMPNVNVIEEMVNMISASRSYQNNVDTMNAAKTMLMKTLAIGQ
ncbi:flagellar basal-body rod protein FlgC [Paucimonas lemoignei]|uniref:Flagellar basal-body rod protein FlgC n=1 Tax=Paucimonas lemoignei TaxID=29443 RepID=A0A4R3I2B3_PAULE|nr:flagellar basal body rod protein FlgC [Paucimonas lemoignei]TCS39163.1 flagellar basal-body rod protein FlgC [Paucimonas lemoignei]